MTIKKPIILVDLDDTLNLFSERFWGVYNTLYNENIDHTKIDDWDLQKFSRDDINVKDLFKFPNLFRHIKLKENAKKFMDSITQKYDVFIVTDSPSGTSGDEEFLKNGFKFSNPADDKRRWVKEHFPEFPQDKIIMCSCKWMVKGDVLVDDKPATFEKFSELGRKCILIDTPYNQHIQTKWRAKTLQDVERLIPEILAS